MVPPAAVKPLFKQIVNQFVHDRSPTESIAVGLNVVREICLWIPLLMTVDLLHDLVLYKKSHEKAVSTAARSLVSLFREICPSLLIKEDRGRPINPKAKPKAFGEVAIPSDVPGAELLQDEKEDDDDDVDSNASDEDDRSIDDLHQDKEDIDLGEEDASSDGDINTHDGGLEFNSDEEDDEDDGEEDEASENEDDVDSYGEDDNEEEKSVHGMSIDSQGTNGIKGQKRKYVDFDGLRALKKLAGSNLENDASDVTDGILSNEDFQRIKELKAKKEAKLALAHHGLLKKASDPKSVGFKIPTSDQLRLKRVDGVTLEVS